ncbi:MAG: hypothetical protein LC808_02945 [Actinobacteria bacterium]|nr:hypothetical protein [Actinomycetota bacterium]
MRTPLSSTTYAIATPMALVAAGGTALFAASDSSRPLTLLVAIVAGTFVAVLAVSLVAVHAVLPRIGWDPRERRDRPLPAIAVLYNRLALLIPPATLVWGLRGGGLIPFTIMTSVVVSSFLGMPRHQRRQILGRRA